MIGAGFEEGTTTGFSNGENDGRSANGEVDKGNLEGAASGLVTGCNDGISEILGYGPEPVGYPDSIKVGEMLISAFGLCVPTTGVG